jgi:hypothetical protein
MRRRVAGGLLPWAAALFLLVACIPPRPSPSPPSAAPATPSPAPTAASVSPTSRVVVDPELLDVLPDEVAGIPITPDLETAAQIADEGSIEPFVSAIALATVFGPPASDGVTDYVVVTVARIRPGIFSDVFFGGWRDTFDAGVCEQAGGVERNAEAEIGGRQTFIGTCVGGVHTYHVRLPAKDLIVSMQGMGDGGWPERIVTGLTE